MSNPYYTHTTYPTPNSPGSSATMRNELENVTLGFDLLPTLAGNGYKVAMVNSAGTALIASAALQSLAITASTINSTAIGATTASTGAFTTVSASGGFTGNITGNITGNVTGNVTGNLTGNVTSSGSNSFASVTISGGTINGTTIGASSATTIQGTTITATVGFVGGLTGNVVGNVTGNLTGNVTAASGTSTFNNVTVSGTLAGTLTGNVTASSGTSTFNDVTINGSLDMNSATGSTISGLSTPTNATDAANKGYVDTADALKLNLTGGTMSGAIAMGTNKITGLGDPTSAQDAATKIYVDNSVQGLDAKASCRAGTTASITLSGAQTIDGVAVIAGDRVLVKDQNTASQNGIYVAAASTWARSADADTWDELVHAYVFVESGTANANNGFVCTVAAGGTLGSTAVTWVQFSGAGQVIAGTGMSKTGNTLNVNTASSARIVVNSDDIDLATTAVTAGTYKSVTVDAYGRATAGTNPTTISGFGITDAYTKTEIDTTVSGLLAKTGGTMSGAIAMGTNKLTGVGDPTNAQDAATKNYIDVLFGSTTAAAASAAAAATSASNALTSANNASSSASAASGSASSASASATAAAASYDSFDDRYLGAKSSPPSVDNDGNALLTGALYFDTTSNLMKVYTGTAWVNAGSSVNGTSQRQVYTATAAQTTFAIIYDVGYVDVYLNGVKQQVNVDFVATNGTSVVFGTGLTAGDIVDIVAYGAFEIANVLPLSGGTMTGAITFVGGQTFPGAGVGSVTSASVVSANGFAGTVATATSTPAITISTSITGVLKGNGTAISAAVAGTDYVTPTGTETLTNKTIAYGSNTLTDVAGVTATQTLTNKTLTAPVIATIVNSGTLTLPTSTDTLVGRATTDTLTNKTISGASNTVTDIPLTTGVTGTLPIANGGTGTTSTTFANLTTNVTGTLPVGNGGTGTTTLTANNVILGNGTSAPLFVAPSTTGNVLTSNGSTWESTAPAAAASPTITAGSLLTINSATSRYISSTGMSSSQAITSYTGVSDYAQACTLNVSGATVTAGTVLTVDASTCYWTSITKLTSTTALMAWRGSNNVKVCVLTVSGTTLTAGSAFTVSSDTPNYIFVSALSSTQVVCTWQNSTIGNYIQTCTINISGTTITSVGTTVNLTALGSTDTAVAGLTSTTAMTIYSKNYAGFPNALSLRFLSISGTSITAGGEIRVGDKQDNQLWAYPINATSMICCLQRESYTVQMFIAGSSGTTATAGNMISIDGQSCSFPSITALSPTRAVMVWTGNGGAQSAVLAINGLSLSIGQTAVVNSGSGGNQKSVCPLSSTKAVIAFMGTSGYLQAAVLDIA